MAQGIENIALACDWCSAMCIVRMQQCSVLFAAKDGWCLCRTGASSCEQQQVLNALLGSCNAPLPSLQGHSHMHMDSVVKMKSLPFDATQLDIIHFFEAYKLKPNGVQLVVRSDNKPTGEVCASVACAGFSVRLRCSNKRN
eukprot:GHRQ01023372.1.p2 GENE.GHRQ01023372.1~~GHRQ01023372.1.p2  ORF type:complete len:141 (-),score=28.12 GHRQ01023372.1:1231-1653(-)